MGNNKYEEHIKKKACRSLLFFFSIAFSIICKPNKAHNEKSSINSSVNLNILYFIKDAISTDIGLSYICV